MSIKELSQSILDASKAVIELSEMKIGIQIVPGSEKKLMPLAKKAGVRFMKPKPGDDEAHVMGDKGSIMKFMLSRGMSKDDVLDVHPELKEEKIEEKKLDPVGKADADIDNDGDTDSSDEYLHKRRAAIKKAMKDEGNKFTGALAKAKEMGEKTFTCAGKQYTVDEVEPIMKGDEVGKKKIVKEKDVKEEYDKDFTPSKHTAGDVSRLDPKEKAGYNKLKAAFIQRNKGEDDMEAAESDEMYNRGKKQKEAANKKLDMLRKQYKASTVKMASSDSHSYGPQHNQKETTMMSGKPEKKSIAQVRRDMQKSVKDANQKLRDAEQKKKERLRKMATMKEALLPLIEEFGVDLVSDVLDSVKKFESLDEAGPIGSVGIRQDFKQDSNRDARVADWKKKQAAKKPIDKMREKIEFMRKQRQRHDDAASDYREKASKIRERNPDDRAADNYDEKADRQEEMGDELTMKIRDLQDKISDAKGK